MTTGDNILIILGGYSSGYKLMRRQLKTDAPLTFKELRYYTGTATKTNSLRVTLARLRRRGLLENDNKLWKLTKKGRMYLHKTLDKIVNKLPLQRHYNYSSEVRNRPKNMILIFDIPERKRKLRDWLRIELVALGFTNLQKSVWFGPAPLPKEFIKTLNELKLLQYVKFFKATEFDIV